jgi:hypothetical protein
VLETLADQDEVDGGPGAPTIIGIPCCCLRILVLEESVSNAEVVGRAYIQNSTPVVISNVTRDTTLGGGGEGWGKRREVGRENVGVEGVPKPPRMLG